MALCAQLSFRSERAAPPIRLRDPGRAGMTNGQASGLLTPLGKPGCLHGCRDSLCLPVHVCARVCIVARARAARLHTRVPASTRPWVLHAGVCPRSRCMCLPGPAANPAACGCGSLCAGTHGKLSVPPPAHVGRLLTACKCTTAFTCLRAARGLWLAFLRRTAGY